MEFPVYRRTEEKDTFVRINSMYDYEVIIIRVNGDKEFHYLHCKKKNGHPAFDGQLHQALQYYHQTNEETFKKVLDAFKKYSAKI